MFSGREANMIEKDHPPQIVIIAGPNGAGKTTLGPRLYRDELNLRLYVNADLIAANLSNYQPEAMALKAGRETIQRMRALAERGESFVFETTLAGLSHMRRLIELKRSGYQVNLMFIWLQSPELAVQRVLQRVEAGGHYIPEAVIQRRYSNGVRNFLSHYRPLADEWGVYDNSAYGDPKLVADGRGIAELQVFEPNLWAAFCEVGNEKKILVDRRIVYRSREGN
jgi:predicted ABC-type ATPase